MPWPNPGATCGRFWIRAHRCRRCKGFIYDREPCVACAALDVERIRPHTPDSWDLRIELGPEEEARRLEVRRYSRAQAIEEGARFFD